MMLGKRIGKNVAAKGAVNTGSLRVPSTRPTGNTAGLEAGRSTFIQPNTSGYGKVKPNLKTDVTPPNRRVERPPLFRGRRMSPQISSQKKIDHWTRVDRALSKRVP